VLLLLFALFIALPIAELYVIIKVGEAIGVLPTIALLILDSLLGTALLRWQGRAAWRRFNEALAENRVPGKEVFDGAMVILGGALLLTPGFITDVFGLLFLLPPTRAAIRRTLTRLFRRRIAVGQRAVFWGGRAHDAYRARRRPGDIEGTGWEVGEEPPPPPALPK
jgi:UPF0716 protein FxsA